MVTIIEKHLDVAIVTMVTVNVNGETNPVTFDPVTRLKLSMGPIRGPGPVAYTRHHVRASMLPKKRLTTHTVHFK